MNSPATSLGSGLEAVVRWCRARPMAVDVILAAIICVLALAEVASASAAAGSEPDGVAYALTVLGAVALIWRRIAPLTVLVVVSAALVAFWLLDYASFQSVLGLPAVYSAAVHGKNRRRTWLTIVVCTLVMFAVAAVTVLDGPDGFSWTNAVSMAVYLSGAAAVGVVIRNREQIFVDLENRADRAEAERLAAALRAVSRERIRIAREMHDVVAHGMSVITVQAAAAQAIMRTDPDAAEESLVQIEAVGRESLDEMRRMLGVLRSGDEEMSTFEPQPRLGDVRNLVAHCTEAGVPTTLEVAGAERELPAGVGLAAYRIVQEALTNVLKHAGTSARANVRLGYGTHTLEVDVTDDGRGAVTSLSGTGSGHGLIGMLERVEVYGGTFNAQPQSGGGYRVTAVLLIEDSTNRPSVVAAEAQATGSPS